MGAAAVHDAESGARVTGLKEYLATLRDQEVVVVGRSVHPDRSEGEMFESHRR
jgi:hypothetical protein